MLVGHNLKLQQKLRQFLDEVQTDQTQMAHPSVVITLGQVSGHETLDEPTENSIRPWDQ